VPCAALQPILSLDKLPAWARREPGAPLAGEDEAAAAALAGGTGVGPRAWAADLDNDDELVGWGDAAHGSRMM
jgi:hypothetical protein